MFQFNFFEVIIFPFELRRIYAYAGCYEISKIYMKMCRLMLLVVLRNVMDIDVDWERVLVMPVMYCRRQSGFLTNLS